MIKKNIVYNYKMPKNNGKVKTPSKLRRSSLNTPLTNAPLATPRVVDTGDGGGGAAYRPTHSAVGASSGSSASARSKSNRNALRKQAMQRAKQVTHQGFSNLLQKIRANTKAKFPDRLNSFNRIGKHNPSECVKILEKWIRDNNMSEEDAGIYIGELNAIFHHPEHINYRKLRGQKKLQELYSESDIDTIIYRLKKINGGPFVKPIKIEPRILDTGKLITYDDDEVHDNILKLLGVYQEEEVGGITQRRKSRENIKGRKNKKNTKVNNKKKGKKNSKKQKKN